MPLVTIVEQHNWVPTPQTQVLQSNTVKYFNKMESSGL